MSSRWTRDGRWILPVVATVAGAVITFDPWPAAPLILKIYVLGVFATSLGLYAWVVTWRPTYG